jgi:hypothetical protein
MADTVKRTVSVKLTEEEIMARADELVSVIAQHTALEAEAKETSKGFRKRLTALDADRDRLAKAIEQRAEEREVETTAEADYREGIVRYRDDKGEVVGTRQLEPEERQLGLGEAAAALVDAANASGPGATVLPLQPGGKKKRGRPRKAKTDAETPDAS